MNEIDKLQLKHLAPYLPHNIKIQSQYGYGDYDYKGRITTMGVFNIEMVNGEKWKPILRPLSDLTKEIVINGEAFMPLNEMNKTLQCASSIRDGRLAIDVRLFSTIIISSGKYYDCIQKLFEWHFDVFGLIKSGLAIDINTI
ncbi:hypothetical protein [Plebeiibacterium sediminum]|uniref:Uncharacterized protein n=1 Tax=Plebeiibacterium sediminum TaxID=2992112 RepID=A0AAE3M0P1_9BACT|nr:hypothetical protein [Plebeiobacterium sediminum]MCW3784912.1 hypothetical protein [Plebeiobacterium sediminum]